MTSPTPEPSQSTEALGAAPPIEEPPGITFYSGTAQRMMRLCVRGQWAGWLLFKHPDGHWVSHHEATDSDLVELSAAARPEPPVEGVCATCGHERQYHGLTVCAACIDVSEGDAPPGEVDAGPHPFKSVEGPVEGALEEARGRVVKSYLNAAWRKPPITGRMRERGDAQAERLVSAMVNRFDEGPLADLIAIARRRHE